MTTVFNKFDYKDLYLNHNILPTIYISNLFQSFVFSVFKIANLMIITFLYLVIIKLAIFFTFVFDISQVFVSNILVDFKNIILFRIDNR